MVEQGLLTQEQIDEEGTTFQLAEDPTNPRHLFFTVVLARAFNEPPPPPGPPASEALTPYTAVIEKDSGAVIAMGRAHWYDGQ